MRPRPTHRQSVHGRGRAQRPAGDQGRLLPSDGLKTPTTRWTQVTRVLAGTHLSASSTAPLALTNAQLVERVGPLLDNLSYSGRQSTYDLRQLKGEG